MIYRSKTNIKNSEETVKFLSNEKGVVLFGTGNFGAIVSFALEKKNIKIINVFDNNRNNWDGQWNNYKVLSPEKINNDYPVIIAATNKKYMKQQVLDKGVTNIYDCDFLFKELDLDGLEIEWSMNRVKAMIDLYLYSLESESRTDMLKVKSLDLVLTEKCTLKCTDCSNLMQYYEKPIDNDYEELIIALDKFMQTIDYVFEIRVIGGEPLMYKNIGSVMEKLISYNQCGNIVIYTNGTIVPKKEKLKYFKDKKVHFFISNYGEISGKTSSLEEALDVMDIPYITERVTTWQDCASSFDKHDRTEALSKFIFGNCCVNDTLTLLHGKLYLCPYSAHAENLKAIPHTEGESINLLDADDNFLKSKISHLYSGREYIEACKYCNGRDHNVVSIEAALQTKSVLPFNMV